MKKKIKKLASGASIRFVLFKVWFLKNMSSFITLGIVTLVFLITFGLMDSSIFGYFGGITTTAISTSILLTKSKKIAIDDITSVNTKKALIRAGLYFDEFGQLKKRKKPKKKNPYEIPTHNRTRRKKSNSDVVKPATVKPSDEKTKKEPNIIKKSMDKVIGPVKEFVTVFTTKLDLDSEIDEDELEDYDVGEETVTENIMKPTIIDTVTPVISLVDPMPVNPVVQTSKLIPDSVQEDTIIKEVKKMKKEKPEKIKKEKVKKEKTEPSLFSKILDAVGGFIAGIFKKDPDKKEAKKKLKEQKKLERLAMKAERAIKKSKKEQAPKTVVNVTIENQTINQDSNTGTIRRRKK